MKVDYIEIRESILPKSKGSKFRKGAGKHHALLTVMAIICIMATFCLRIGEIVNGFIAITALVLAVVYLEYISKHFLERSYKVHRYYDYFSQILAQYGIDDPDAFAENVEILENYFRFRGNEIERRNEINRLLGIFYGEAEAKEDDEKLLGMLSRGDTDGK